MIEIIFLEFINLFIKIWLTALICNLLFSTFLRPVYKSLLAIGLLFSFPVKRLFYWIYGVPVEQIDWEKGLIKTEKVKNLDCLLTTTVIMPVFILSYLSTWLVYFAGEIFSNYKFLAFSLYVIAILVLAFSIPSLEELKLLSEVNLHSTLFYILKVVIAGITSYTIFTFTKLPPDFSTLIILALLSTPLYRHSSEELDETEQIKKALGDPFA